jgi:cell division protease FtsH
MIRKDKLQLIKQTPYGELESIPISDFYNDITSKSMSGIYISNDLKEIYIKNTEDPRFDRVVHSNPLLTQHLVEKATENQVKTIILEPPNGIFEQGQQIIGGLFNFVFISILFSLVMNIFRRTATAMSFNPFKEDKTVDQSQITTRLTDWAGSPEVFEECFEIVSYIKNSTIYKAVGAELPKGILLDGPPGTGKTLLAKAIAGETNATFLSMAGSEFVELFIGLGASKVRQLFEEARQNAPSIIFIDEIDAIGKKRSGANAINSNDEREQTLNQILSEMDGFQPNNGVLVLAATNRRDVLDEALLRPGRFDRLIYVPLPDQSSRESILQLYLKNKNILGLNVTELAVDTAGFSGAQLKNLLNEAAILAARGGSTIVTKENIEGALEKVVVGIIKKTDKRSIVVRTRVAIHELGHAILTAYFKDEFVLKKVSLKSTYTGVGGFTFFGEKQDIQEGGLYTKDLMMKRMIIALGGKAAEKIAYSEFGVSFGASQDLKEANELARAMVEQYGMGDCLESFSLSNRISETTREMVDREIFFLTEYAMKEAERILSEKQSIADSLLIRLLKEDVLNGDVVLQMVHPI